MIAVIDYGVGNLRSVQKAFEFLGAETVVTRDPERVREASHVVLPGVGAFGDAMEQLARVQMDRLVTETVESGKPFLGICLGMQLLFEGSDEGGWHSGLGLFPGRVAELPHTVKVPHMGWNNIAGRRADGVILENPWDSPYVYFVHSFHRAVPDTAGEAQAPWVAAVTEYGVPFVSAIRKGHCLGVQFHPEKSGSAGLAMLERFIKLSGKGGPYAD